MTERTMRGLLRSAAACVPLLALFPSLALAQTVPTQPQQTQAISADLVVKRGADRVPSATVVYANVADCGGDPTDPDYFSKDPNVKSTASLGSIYEFSVMYTSNVPVVEAWLGVGENEDCSTPANRTVPSNVASSAPVCTKLGVITDNTREPVFKIPARRIFNQSGIVTDDDNVGYPTIGDKLPRCDAVSGSPRYTVYILALPTATQATQAEPVLNVARANLKASFSPFTRRPAAPTNLTGVNGENRLEVSFKAPSSSVPLTNFRAYFDTNQGTGGGTPTPTVDAGPVSGLDGGLLDASVVSGSDASTGGGGTEAGTGTLSCGSGSLQEDLPAPQNQSGITATSKSDSKTAVLTDLTNVEINESVAAAAVSIDPAGNESRLSEPICVTRKLTNSFLDECQAAGEGTCGLHSCSIDPTGKGSALSAALFLLAVAALIRRRGRA